MPGVTTCLHTVVVQRHMGHMTCVEEILPEVHLLCIDSRDLGCVI